MFFLLKFYITYLLLSSSILLKLKKNYNNNQITCYLIIYKLFRIKEKKIFCHEFINLHKLSFSFTPDSNAISAKSSFNNHFLSINLFCNLD